MTVNLQIDEVLIQEALALSNQQTEHDVVEQALREYVQRRQQMKILDLFGTIDYDDDYNYKQQRHKQ
ncbi:type II toxin-antitoxin system VapB family antitoxin [Nostoc parmelioides]|jgi:Arc/MetJ family transcription regulator|uniref:Type II toxin-antitoxin system VapB family antitoxin n=1 Tax=Nostoc parmelioides FACHB-3921 TaxID=2692909 RepID=A0ABR8BJE6_9NOSO|nr:type II toxin-antitoxin system VapB family antitoxin [Nostoc parmelioides]MBD2254045.1 type II toxin-antitoxin system VapB family antitoxin [Nostoc parmelioides FACHB-3921]